MGDKPDMSLIAGLFLIFSLLAFAAPKLAVVLFVWRRQERSVVLRSVAASVADLGVTLSLALAMASATSMPLAAELSGRLVLWLAVIVGSMTLMTIANRLILTTATSEGGGAAWREAVALATLSLFVGGVLRLAIGPFAL